MELWLMDQEPNKIVKYEIGMLYGKLSSCKRYVEEYFVLTAIENGKMVWTKVS